MTRPPPTKPMSVFEHHVAQCTIAHQAAVRAARNAGDDRERMKEVSNLTIIFIHKLHRLGTLVAEMGAPAIFGTPAEEIGVDEAARLFPP